MENFSNLVRAASQLKNSKSLYEKKQFDALPEYSKIGLYCSEMFKNVRKQSFKLKKISYENLKLRAIQLLKEERYTDAHYLFCRVSIPLIQIQVAYYLQIHNI